jgi:ribosomal protein S21
VSQTRKRQDDKRERDLAEFKRQVDEGTLTIRQMTAKERRENPPREPPPKRRAR